MQALHSAVAHPTVTDTPPLTAVRTVNPALHNLRAGTRPDQDHEDSARPMRNTPDTTVRNADSTPAHPSRLRHLQREPTTTQIQLLEPPAPPERAHPPAPHQEEPSRDNPIPTPATRKSWKASSDICSPVTTSTSSAPKPGPWCSSTTSTYGRPSPTTTPGHDPQTRRRGFGCPPEAPLHPRTSTRTGSRP